MVGALLAAALLQQQPQQSPQQAVGPTPTPAALAVDTGSLRHTSGRTPPVATAARVPHGTIHIDGRFDEPAWAVAEPVTAFTQRQPQEGDPATERTEVRIVYDDAAIYVAARMYDADPAGIRTELARRDASYQSNSSDWFGLAFDSYHDHTSSFTFRVNPSGIKSDRLNNQDNYSIDEGWDPVWDVATSRDSLGWTAEIRIPFSQLCFPNTETQV